jgi:hypothetical protein
MTGESLWAASSPIAPDQPEFIGFSGFVARTNILIVLLMPFILLARSHILNLHNPDHIG